LQATDDSQRSPVKSQRIIQVAHLELVMGPLLGVALPAEVQPAWRQRSTSSSTPGEEIGFVPSPQARKRSRPGCKCRLLLCQLCLWGSRRLR
jgi:hypothetical protein